MLHVTAMHDETKHLNKIIKEFTNAMLVTRHPPGVVRARPMRIAKHESDGALWFMSDRHTAKLDDIEEDSRVAVTMQSPDRFVCITGLADVITDRRRIEELWSPAWLVWFPKGKTDPDLIALRVTPVEAEYWDSSGVFRKAKILMQAAQAVISRSSMTGEDPNQHAHVSY